MATVRELRDRIRSLKNTQQITKAMKQVAAAKIRRAEAAQKRARPYAQTLAAMLDDLAAAVTSVDHPYMKSGKAGAPAGVILMTADKGLAGAFNANVIRAGETFAEQQPSRFFAVGTKARNAIRRLRPEGSNLKPPADPIGGVQYTEFWYEPLAGDKIGTAKKLAQRLGEEFAKGYVSEIVLACSTFVSMMSQRPVVRKLVPVVREELTREQKREGRKGAVEFLPSPEFVLARLLPKYLEFTIYAAMLETDAAFFAAQLVAMSNATDNAGKAIDELTIAMNNARQAAITKELLEVVAGAEALAG